MSVWVVLDLLISNLDSSAPTASGQQISWARTIRSRARTAGLVHPDLGAGTGKSPPLDADLILELSRSDLEQLEQLTGAAIVLPRGSIVSDAERATSINSLVAAQTWCRLTMAEQQER